jgi:hypothetical protein
MGLRFRKSIKIVPGVRLNVGLKRASLSIGGRGFTYNIGSKGSRVTVGIPGSGLSYSTNVPQNPIGLPARPSGRRSSATSFVIAAFLLGLLYISLHSTNNSNTPSTGLDRDTAGSTDTTGSIPQIVQENISPLDGPIPLPRPRPRARTESVGPPLQIAPQQ